MYNMIENIGINDIVYNDNTKNGDINSNNNNNNNNMMMTQLTQPRPISKNAISDDVSGTFPATIVSCSTVSVYSENDCGDSASMMSNKTDCCLSPNVARGDLCGDDILGDNMYNVYGSDYNYTTTADASSSSPTIVREKDYRGAVDDSEPSETTGKTTTTTTTTTITTKFQTEKEKMKRNRREMTATCGIGGAVFGTIACPVVGTVIGGAISGYSANLIMKQKEKRLERKLERDQFEEYAAHQSDASKYAVFV